jgi:exodeoxyribonuclease-5
MPTTSDIVLTDEQNSAQDRIVDWVLNQPDKQEFELGGYAGTGKTTLMKFLRARLTEEDVSTQVAAFTGKACNVLQRKGIHASTLHSIMYVPHTDPKTHEMTFELRPPETLECDLMIVDEASMVSTELYKDLKTFGVKILWVGDPGQLEPVGDNPHLMVKPDFTLSTIHRQALESPIITLATDIRTGGIIDRAKHPRPGELDIRSKTGMKADMLLMHDQIICAKNKTREYLNNLMRQAHGYSDQPNRIMVGEKLICLHNNLKLGVFNGMIFFVDAITEEDGNDWYVTMHTEDGQTYQNFPLWKRPFLEELPKQNVYIPKAACWCTYAYAVTCHKSQGSEWDKVMVFDEWMPPTVWDMKRWRYTAVTRAAKYLTFCL